MRKLLVLIQNNKDAITANLEWIIGIFLSFAVGILGVIGWFPPNIIFAATLFVLGLFSVGSLRDRLVSEHREKVIRSNELLFDGERTGISRVFPRAMDVDWLPYINEAHHVTIVSIKLTHFLWKGGYTQALEAVLARGGTVTLVMADPRSPLLWLRFQDERTPTETRSGAAEDLARVTYKLHEWRQRLVQEGVDSNRLLIRVFQNYPTQAFCKFDKKILFYNYQYRAYGYNAPTFLFTDEATPVYRFLNQSLQSLVTSSLALENEIVDIWDKYNAQCLSDQKVFQAEIVAVSKDKYKNK